MDYNLSTFDIILRFFVAMTVIILGAFTGMFFPMIIGMILVVTGLAGYCPIYHAIGIKKKDMV